MSKQKQFPKPDLKKAFVFTTPSWNRLAMFGQNRLLGSLSIWIILVPILAKVFSELPDQLELTIDSMRVSIVLQLPFDLKVFYVAAITATMGKLIYAFRCPELIKIGNYADFQRAGLGTGQLGPYLGYFFRSSGHMYNLSGDKMTPTELMNWLVKKYGDNLHGDDKKALQASVIKNPISAAFAIGQYFTRDQRVEADLYWDLRNRMGVSFPIWRICCGLCYLVAFIGISVVTVKSAYTVWQVL